MKKIMLELELYHGYEHPEKSGRYFCVVNGSYTTELYFSKKHGAWNACDWDDDCSHAFRDSEITAWARSDLAERIEESMPILYVCEECGNVFQVNEIEDIEVTCLGERGDMEVEWTEHRNACPYCHSFEIRQQEYGE